MSEVRLTIRDASGPIHGTIHGSVADAVIAALAAEPETIAELEAALQRFIKPVEGYGHFASFHPGSNQEPWDAGIVIVDLPARIVAVESSYSNPQAQGEIEYHDGSKAADVWVLYRVPDDWLFVNSVDEYRAARDQRTAHRAEAQPLDSRQVFYGPAMIEFIVTACVEHASNSVSSENTPFGHLFNASASVPAAPTPANCEGEIGHSGSSDPIAAIHARWLTTPRADLRGETPRDVMLAKLEFIDYDLHTREMQWSMLGEGPPPLARDSFAYRFAGFGTHEYVLYYDLMRHLLHDCWQNVQGRTQVEICSESSRLNRVKESWMNEPQPDVDDRIPTAIIESERRRIPLVMTSKSKMIDEDCELCQMLADETSEIFGLGFWHLDGSDMDEGFVFSSDRDREAWEKEEQRRREADEEFNREWAKGHGTGR